MDSRSHLHDAEQLLLSMHPGTALLVRGLLQGIVDAFVATIVVSLAVLAALWFGFETLPPLYVYVLIFIVSYGLIAWRKHVLWSKSSLRVTTDRILMQYPKRLSMGSLKTIKWNQYQESYTSKGGALNVLFRSKQLCVRYGTADAHNLACFPSVSYAVDVKHYMDKVDSSVRSGKIAEVKPFVAKPKGHRD